MQNHYDYYTTELLKVEVDLLRAEVELLKADRTKEHFITRNEAQRIAEGASVRECTILAGEIRDRQTRTFWLAGVFGVLVYMSTHNWKLGGFGGSKPFCSAHPEALPLDLAHTA
jgi:hypothetical protein